MQSLPYPTLACPALPQACTDQIGTEQTRSAPMRTCRCDVAQVLSFAVQSNGMICLWLLTLMALGRRKYWMAMEAVICLPGPLPHAAGSGCTVRRMGLNGLHGFSSATALAVVSCAAAALLA